MCPANSSLKGNRTLRVRVVTEPLRQSSCTENFVGADGSMATRARFVVMR